MSSYIELKKVLRDELELNAELLDFIESMLKIVHPDKYQMIFEHIQEMVSYMDNYGCIQSYNTVLTQLGLKKKEEEEEE
jgi:hypothetical protein